MSEVVKFYENYHRERLLEQGREDLSNFPTNLQLINLALQQGTISKNASLLDVGCGSGLMIEHLNNEGFQVSGIDLSQTALSFRRKRNKKVGLAQADFIRLPFGENTFDGVLSFDSIEHVDNMTPFLTQIKRVLKPKGVIIFRTPNIYFSKVFSKLKRKAPDGQLSYHPKLPSLQTFRSLRKNLAKGGFDTMFYKLPVTEGTTKSELKLRLGRFAAIAQRFPWKMLPLDFYPVYYGIATLK